MFQLPTLTAPPFHYPAETEEPLRAIRVICLPSESLRRIDVSCEAWPGHRPVHKDEDNKRQR